MPGTHVRPIEYEVMRVADARGLGVARATVEAHLGPDPEMAVLRCVDRDGEKLTAVGRVERWKALLASGEAGDPNGLSLSERDFPVVVRGWPNLPMSA